MATDAKFVEYLCEQLHAAGGISTRRMFGEYAVYKRDTVVALVCNNQLYVKPTPQGRALIGTPTEAPPYPGAKPHFLIDAMLDDPEALCELITATAAALPPPKPKKAAKTAAKKKTARPKAGARR